jgi:hypothetical protein
LQIYKEEEYREGTVYNMDEKLTSRFKMQELPIKLNGIKNPPTDKANPPIGVSMMGWSQDSRFLATKNGNFKYS